MHAVVFQRPCISMAQTLIVCVQGLLLRLFTYLGLKYCNQRSKHSPVARLFTRMWMLAKYLSTMPWWSEAKLESHLPAQEHSHSMTVESSQKTNIHEPLLG